MRSGSTQTAVDRILILDADAETRGAMVSSLVTASLEIEEAESMDRALGLLRTQPFRVLVADAQAGDEAFFIGLRREFPDLSLIMAVAPSCFPSAQMAVRAGARELIAKSLGSGDELRVRVAELLAQSPSVEPDDLLETLRTINGSLEKEKELLRRRISSTQRNLKHQVRTLHRSREIFVTDLSRVMAIIDNMADGIVFTDENGKVILINPAAARMLETPSFTVMGRNLSVMQGNRGLHSVLATHRALELSEEGEEVDISTRREDGKKAHYSVRTSPVPDFRGEITGLLSLIRDISLQAKTDRLKNQFLSIVAHELRTPLTTIKAFATILDQGICGELSEKQKPMVENIVTQSDRLGHEIDKIINMGRLGAADFAPDLEDVTSDHVLAKIDAPFQSEAETRDMTIRVKNDAKGKTIRVDRQDVQRALRALVENALKFTPDGGTIEVAALSDGDDVIFEVRDDGIGIAPTNHEVIFERFMQLEDPLTRQHGGSGMGLSFAAEIMKAHGSRIEVESELGAGATFRFRFRTVDPSAVANASERQES